MARASQPQKGPCADFPLAAKMSRTVMATATGPSMRAVKVGHVPEIMPFQSEAPNVW